MKYNTVKRLTQRAREIGIEVTPLPPRPLNEHGGGKLGITGCDCEPCVTKRLTYKANWQREHRKSRKKQAGPS
jgi:hypothetical protein